MPHSDQPQRLPIADLYTLASLIRVTNENPLTTADVSQQLTSLLHRLEAEILADRDGGAK